MHGVRGSSREEPCFKVHWPVHVDYVQSEKAIADGLDPSFLDLGARLC